MKRYSDLESEWLGGTEKNINSAFREAESSNEAI
jgi:SpoVK/Ycf46/Vps4 family AAA+-type ATPase